MFKGHKLLKKDDDQTTEEVDAESVVNAADVLLVYFAAYHSHPCTGFTRLLKDFWDEASTLEDKVVIIFVSMDRDENQFKDNLLEHGDYYAIPFLNQGLIEKLKNKCNVTEIPMLFYLKDGECKHPKVGDMIHNYTPAAEIVEKLKYSRIC